MANHIEIPSGAQWSAVLDAVSQVSPGGTILLPDETIVQTSGLKLATKPVSIIGSGPNSNLKHLGNLTIAGSGRAISLEEQSGITLANFGIEGNTTQGKGWRTQAVVIGPNSKNITLRNLRFKNISATCVAIKSFQYAGALTEICDVNIDHCTADNFWEQFVELGSGLHDIYITRNNIKTHSRNAQVSGTPPFGLIVDIETPPAGEIYNVLFAHNVVDFSLLPDRRNAIGVQVCEGRADPWRYTQIEIVGNTFLGCYQAIRYQGTRGVGQPGGTIVYACNNYAENIVLEPVRIDGIGAVDASDVFVIAGNRYKPRIAGQPFIKQTNAAQRPITKVAIDNQVVN